VKKLTALFVFTAAIFSSHCLLADNEALKKIGGKVIDTEGAPIPGAAVVVEGKPALGGQ